MKINKLGLIEMTEQELLDVERFNVLNALCGGIQMGALYDCDNPINAGVSTRLILMDKEVWDNATKTYDATVATLLTDVVLTGAGSVAWAFEGVRRSVNPQSAFVPATVSSGFDHQVTFQVFDISQEQKDNIEAIGLNNIVAIVENANSLGNDNSVFEVFGKDVGMQLQAGAMRINADPETNGSYTLDLKTPDDQGKEPKLPTSWWDTDYATTKAKVDALLIPVV